MSEKSSIGDVHRALVWCLKNGVKAVDFGVTGYWSSNSCDGYEIMPPADIHVVLDAARKDVLSQGKTTKSED